MLISIYSFILGVQTLFILTRYFLPSSFDKRFRPLVKLLPQRFAKTSYTLVLYESQGDAAKIGNLLNLFSEIPNFRCLEI